MIGKVRGQPFELAGDPYYSAKLQCIVANIVLEDGTCLYSIPMENVVDEGDGEVAQLKRRIEHLAERLGKYECVIHARPIFGGCDECEREAEQNEKRR